MTFPAHTTTAVLITILGVAVWTDVRERRIPNWLTFGGAAAGLALNGVLNGPGGLQWSSTGWLVGLALLLPLFLLRGIGAGDVKLVAAIGALQGPEVAFFTCLWAGIAGGALALLGLIWTRRLGLAASNLYYSGASLLLLRARTGGSVLSAGRIPYAPAIAFGALLSSGGVRWLVG